MNRISINEIAKSTKFIIQNFCFDKVQKLKLMELGILPNIQVELLYKNRFGSTVIRCNGAKYAVDNSIAQKILASEVTNIRN